MKPVAQRKQEIQAPPFRNLREVRWAKGITAEQCASALDLELFDFMSRERGRKSFTLDQRAVLAGLLELSPSTLGAIIQALPKPRRATRSNHRHAV